MTQYCTLAAAKAELKADSTVDDAKLRRYIDQVSRRIDSVMGSLRRPYFAPYIEARQFVVSQSAVNSLSNVFWHRDNLLAVSAATLGTNSITDDVEVYPPSPSPYPGLRFTSRNNYWYQENSDYDPVFVTITGTWGYHPDYAHAYDAVDALTVNLAAIATATSVTVADADGADLDGFTPRFSPGNLIRINSEWMQVNAVNTTTNVLTVRRAVNGSTLAAHVISDAVEVFQVDERIQRIATRQAGLLYARQGAYQIETLDGVGAITYPQDLLIELRSVLTEVLNGTV